MILEPGPGSRLSSPIHVAGEADSTFEQALGVRVVLDDGTELVTIPTTIAAELGQRGPFAVDVPFSLSQDRQAFIQVFTTSPRDGGVTHLAAVGVTLSPAGEPQIVPVQPYPERIAILQPRPGDRLRGGTLHVTGFGLASFEQTLLVEVLDADGKLIGSHPVIVGAPEPGEVGPFEADVTYTLSAAGPSRVVVRDVSPAFGGDVHRASVEIALEP
jgi:hypothetical protein